MRQIHRRNETQSSLIFAAAGSLLSYLAWDGPEWVGLAALLPLLWVIAETRWQAAAVTSAYYLVGSRCLPDSTTIYFANEHSYYIGVAMWIGAGAMCTAPWALLWKREGELLNKAGRLGVVILAISVPPIAIVGWLNPWMGASAIIPGFAWGSVLLGLAFLFTLTAMGQLGKMWAAGGIAMVVASQIVGASVPAPHAIGFESWKVFETSWGQFPKPNSKEERERWRLITHEAEAAFAQGFRTVLMPEQIAGRWDDRANTFIHTSLAPWFDKGNTLVLGAEVIEQRTFGNAMLVLGVESDRIYARQTVPAAMWRPWSSLHYPSNWMREGKIQIAGKKVAVLMCYEDFIFSLGLLSFIGDKPEALLSIANAWWWAGDSNLIETQRLHAATLAKIFGVPLLRSINLPTQR